MYIYIYMIYIHMCQHTHVLGRLCRSCVSIGKVTLMTKVKGTSRRRTDEVQGDAVEDGGDVEVREEEERDAVERFFFFFF